MAFGPDGNFYVSNFAHCVVDRFDRDTGAYLGVFASGINWPNGLAFGPDGRLYVASEQDAKIVRFNGTTGAFVDDFATDIGFDIGGVQRAYALIGIAFAAIPVPEPTMLTMVVLPLTLAAIRRRQRILVPECAS